MTNSLSHRKATIHDLKEIVCLLADDDLGIAREIFQDPVHQCYIDAFHRIDADPHQYLMVVERGAELIGTCHVTLMPSLTHLGQTRLQIEAVRVSRENRGQGIGKWMLKAAMAYGKAKGASIVQLTTSKQRPEAINFYEGLGFERSHEGFKLFL